MRVLHVITALGVGGAERMLLKLLRANATADIEQRVVVMLPGGALISPMRSAGTAVDELDFLGGIPVLTGALDLARIVRSYDPDLVQGWLYHGNLGASLARAVSRRRVPLLWGIRQSLPTLEGENVLARVGIALNRWCSGQPERLLFNSRTSLAEHRAAGFHTERAEYLPNGFETRDFAPNPAARVRWRAEWQVGDETVVFGLFARYHPVKDHAGFLRSARTVHSERPDTRFVLAGTDVVEENQALTELIRDAGLADCVHLLGERHDVPEILAAIDVYVSSSAREAFSNSVGEAMSCAVPCVVTHVGDSLAVVGDTGLVIPPGNPAALSAAMIDLVDRSRVGRTALGEQARHRVIREFDIESVAGRYRDLYDRLVSDGRGRA